MKLSTDAVLLGAFVNVQNSKFILDIGTGSGIIALMMAQRSDAFITGIDIDKNSIKDALKNFSNSPWANRLTGIHKSLQDYVKSGTSRFDHIVCNPPFFTNSLHSPFNGRTLSKHNVSLSFSELLDATNLLMKANGKSSFIIPASDEELIISLSENNDLFLSKIMDVFPKESKPVNRIMLEFSKFCPENVERSSLVIRQEDNQYTTDYKEFTRDFYLDL